MGFLHNGPLALRTSDLELAQRHLSTILADHSLHCDQPGRRVDFLHRTAGNSALSLHRVRYGAPLWVQTGAPLDFYLLQLTLRGGSTIRSGSRSLETSPGMLTVLNCGDSYRKFWASDTDQLMLRIDRRAFDRVAVAEFGGAVGGHILFEPVPTPVSSIPALFGMIRLICEDFEGPRHLDEPRVSKRVTETLLSLLLHSIPNNYRHALDGQRSPAAPRYVSRAEAFIDQHAADDIALSDVATAAGVSPRTLGMGFRRFRDTTPMDHLRNVRLERAHRALQAGGERGTVTMVAAECGLHHFGRFARDYRRRFGELPSETLARGRARH
jgi:AraC-like DNA-binding protein